MTGLSKILIIVVLLAVVLYGVYHGLQSKQELVYKEHLDDTAAVVDGEALTLADVAFYVVYEEMKVEEQAEIYNPDNTKDYWNGHVNGIFIAVDARKTALGMAVHDLIFYNAAIEKGMELTDEEKAYLENERSDFWMDLYDEQQDNLPVSDEQINASIDRMALAQKYQTWIAEQNGCEYSQYDWDSYDYTLLLEAAHTVEENTSIWERVNVGEVSLNHSEVNYINGMTDSEREEFQAQQEENHRTLLDDFIDMLKGNENEDDNETD